MISLNPAPAPSLHLPAADWEDVLDGLGAAAYRTSADIDCPICAADAACPQHDDHWARVDRWRALATRLRHQLTATCLTGGPASSVRLLLNLSNAHLPEQLGKSGLDTAPGVLAHPTDSGWLMWVPNNPDQSAAATVDRVPETVLAIQRYARSLGCDYLLFDADADRVDNLPTWDW